MAEPNFTVRHVVTVAPNDEGTEDLRREFVVWCTRGAAAARALAARSKKNSTATRYNTEAAIYESIADFWQAVQIKIRDSE